MHGPHRSAHRHRGTGNATYTQSSPSAAKAALCIAGDRECPTGSPMTPTTRVAPVITRPPFTAAPFAGRLDVGLVLLLRLRERVLPVLVAEHVEHVRHAARVLRRLQRLHGDARDRSRRQARDLVRVVRRVDALSAVVGDRRCSRPSRSTAVASICSGMPSRSRLWITAEISGRSSSSFASRLDERRRRRSSGTGSSRLRAAPRARLVGLLSKVDTRRAQDLLVGLVLRDEVRVGVQQPFEGRHVRRLVLRPHDSRLRDLEERVAAVAAAACRPGRRSRPA